MATLWQTNAPMTSSLHRPPDQPPTRFQRAGPCSIPSIPGWVLVPIAPHTLSNRPIVLADITEIAIELVNGRDASANFDMQSLASLLHGDRILVRRSEYSVRFLHPRGWNYFDTLRKKLLWNEGGS